MADDPDEVSGLAQDIESYLARRPNASDTIEGIRRWWVGARWADASVALMSAALDQLVHRGVMAGRTLADGSVVYFSAARKEPTGPPGSDESGRDKTGFRAAETDKELAGKNEDSTMSVIIENLTEKPIWLRLNSGASLCVMPHTSAKDVADSEVRGNPKLRRLHDEKVIRTQPLYGEPEPAQAGSSERESSEREEPKSDRTRTGAHRRHS